MCRMCWNPVSDPTSQDISDFIRGLGVPGAKTRVLRGPSPFPHNSGLRAEIWSQNGAARDLGPTSGFVWHWARTPPNAGLAPRTPNSRIKSDLSWRSGSQTGFQGTLCFHRDRAALPSWGQRRSANSCHSGDSLRFGDARLPARRPQLSRSTSSISAG
jgi:hypothetical protein